MNCYLRIYVFMSTVCTSRKRSTFVCVFFPLPFIRVTAVLLFRGIALPLQYYTSPSVHILNVSIEVCCVLAPLPWTHLLWLDCPQRTSSNPRLIRDKNLISQDITRKHDGEVDEFKLIQHSLSPTVSPDPHFLRSKLSLRNSLRIVGTIVVPTYEDIRQESY